MNPLPAKRRSELRTQAHQLSPVVIIGDKGLTDEVVAEVDRSLKAHELVKVRAASAERDARDVWMETLCERLAAHPIQQIGKILVLYREAEKAPEERRKPRANLVGKPPAKPPKGTARPRSRTPSPRPESAPRKRRPRTSR
jgi:RNA-binding protein